MGKNFFFLNFPGLIFSRKCPFLAQKLPTKSEDYCTWTVRSWIVAEEGLRMNDFSVDSVVAGLYYFPNRYHQRLRLRKRRIGEPEPEIFFGALALEMEQMVELLEQVIGEPAHFSCCCSAPFGTGSSEVFRFSCAPAPQA